LSIEPMLNMKGLCDGLSIWLGRKVIRDCVYRRIQMGMPHHIDRGSGRKLYVLSEVQAWWTRPAYNAKAS